MSGPRSAVGTDAPPDTREAVITVRGLTMAYGNHVVLHGIDVTVPPGQLFALLGPNGAGKTTTVEILEGYRRRSGGEVRVLGMDPQHAGEKWRSRVGVVMQSWSDHARWRVGELVSHFADYYPNPYRPAELLDLVGLAKQANQELGKLSGGQRRRVDVALGIIGRPELLFLDEPTTGFDPQARAAFHELIVDLKRQGMTIILTTHDLAEAERLADQTAVLIDGRLVAIGTPAQLAEQVAAKARVAWIDDSGVAQVRYTQEPEQLVYQLHQDIGGPIPGLEVVRPTLEQSYLGLLGTPGSTNGHGSER